MLGRLNKIKSDFVSIVGHELRTPLTSIQGFSEIIRDEDLTREEVTEYAADINAEAQRLSRLIDDMLDLDTCSTSVDVQLDQEDRLASQVGGQGHPRAPGQATVQIAAHVALVVPLSGVIEVPPTHDGCDEETR